MENFKANLLCVIFAEVAVITTGCQNLVCNNITNKDNKSANWLNNVVFTANFANIRHHKLLVISDRVRIEENCVVSYIIQLQTYSKQVFIQKKSCVIRHTDVTWVNCHSTGISLHDLQFKTPYLSSTGSLCSPSVQPLTFREHFCKFWNLNYV